MIFDPAAQALYKQAEHLVSRYQIATCSFLQRHLKIRYADACSLIERLDADNRIPAMYRRMNVTNFATIWLVDRSQSRNWNCIFSLDFFDVEPGIGFANEDLYSALIGSKEADDVSVGYAATIIDDSTALSVTDQITQSLCCAKQIFPADGIVLKITCDPRKLFWRDVKEIISVLTAHSSPHCDTALAIKYDYMNIKLLIEVIASKVKS